LWILLGMHFINVGTHCFVYWENEDAGSIATVKSVEKKPVVAGIRNNEARCTLERLLQWVSSLCDNSCIYDTFSKSIL